jgi:hypothetical protein
MNLKSGRIGGFEGYSQFKNVKEFNTHIEMWLAVKKHEFSKGELIGLKRTDRYVLKTGEVMYYDWMHSNYDNTKVNKS